ncbi:MAG: phosphatase PAP2 family protein [Pseudomonadales bacterium]
MNALQEWFWPDFVPATVLVTDWGGPLGWIFAMQLTFYLLGVRQGVFIGLVAVLSLLLNSWLKSLLFLPRPYMLDPTVQVHQPTPGLGMPSGHAQGAAALWYGIANFGRSLICWRLLALFVIALVCLSRVILGVHSVAQVVIGAALGFSVLGLCLRVREPLLAWLRARGSPTAIAAVFVALLAALFVTMAIDGLRADQLVPALWQENFAHASRGIAGASELSLHSLLASAAAYALVMAALGLALIGFLQKHRPVRLDRWTQRLLCVFVGCLVTALFWWFAGASDWTNSPLALLLPLLYPLVCGYLPVALTDRLCRWRGRHAQEIAH